MRVVAARRQDPKDDLISVLAFGALLIVLVIAIYSAFFLAVVANRLY